MILLQKNNPLSLFLSVFVIIPKNMRPPFAPLVKCFVAMAG